MNTITELRLVYYSRKIPTFFPYMQAKSAVPGDCFSMTGASFVPWSEHAVPQAWQDASRH